MGRYLDICKEVMRDRWARQAAALLAQVRDDDLRADLRDRFEERAGICEYDSAMNRDEAERAAFEEIRSAWNPRLDDLGESAAKKKEI